MYQVNPPFLDQHTGLVKLMPVETPLPTLGSGLSFRPAYRNQVLRHHARIDCLEIIADHYLHAGALKKAELGILAHRFTVVPHALNLSLGSACGPDPDYLAVLAELIQALNPPWWSEHIAFTRTATIDIGHVTPLPYTWEAVEVVCRNVRTVRQQIQTPLLLENITNRVTLPGAQMSEAEFIGEILERTGCGLLLNVDSLAANAVNRDCSPLGALAQWPLERVVQVHYSGSTPDIQPLLTEVLQRKAPVKAVILEWNDQPVPPFKDILPELANTRELGRKFGAWN
jgi:uncharacterized protein (UPF0276 family)